MSGPVQRPLTTQESDKSVIVRPTSTLSFNAADFTVAGTGTTATISIDSTGTGAALTAKYVGFGNVSNLLTGSADLQWDDTAKELTVVGDSDNDAVVLIKGGETAAGEGPKLEIRNTAGTDSFVKLFTDNYNVTYMDGGVPGGTTRNIWKSGQLSADTFVTTFNNDALPADFQIKGDTEANLFYLDGGQDNVGIGGTPDSGVERLHVQTTNLATVLQRWETTAAPTTADFAVKLELEATGTPLDNAAGLGCIDFKGKDSAGNDHTYVRMAVIMADKGTGSEDGLLKFDVTDGGTDFIEHLQMGNGNVVINEDQVNVSFRVEGDSDDSLIRTVASDDSVGIGTLPDTNTAKLQVTDDGTKSYTILLESTDGDANAGPTFGMWRNSPSPAAGDDIGTIYFAGEDDGGGRTNYCQIDGEADGIVANNESGTINFRVVKSGNLRKAFRIRYSEVVVNEDSNDINFRVESDGNSNMFQVDAGLNIVAVGTQAYGTASADGTLQVKDGTISSYKHLTNVSGTSPQTLDNEDLQSKLFVHNSASAHQYNLPAGVRGMYLKFVSTDGNITIQPDASDTINGGVAGASVTRSIDNQIYECVCYDANKWIVSNP